MLLKNFVQINPKVDLEKGKIYPYVGMADVNPSRGYVTNSETREYKNSRSRFKEGDTLFARITPCLENGKISRFKSDGLKRGFGSTEFFVFRAKEGISDPNYVYYLSRSPFIRKTAEKSMAGASGRQRADISAIEEIKIDPPDLPTQQKIGSILSAFDDLIENNTRRIEILEEMARRIYREWFVHFRYPGHEEDPSTGSGRRLVDSGTDFGKIPAGWEVKKLGEIVEINRGKTITKKTTGDGDIPVVAGGLTPAYTHNKANTKCPVITISASGANAGYVNLYQQNIWASDCSYIDANTTPHVYFYYLQLKDRQNNIFHLQHGSAQPHVYPKDLNRLKSIDFPLSIIESFDKETEPIFLQIKTLHIQNKKLKETRDLLLPKLISGEVKIG
jgi:type I restriction enzyme S subunit